METFFCVVYCIDGQPGNDFCVKDTATDDLLEIQNVTFTPTPGTEDPRNMTFDVVGSGYFCYKYGYGGRIIPEFSTAGVILALIIIALGVAIIKKRG